MSLYSHDSYYDEYVKQRGSKRTAKEEQSIATKLLTDRTAYITYLEVQLERVTVSCLTSQGQSERIDQLQSMYVGLETKLQNIGKLLKILGESHANGSSKSLGDFDETHMLHLIRSEVSGQLSNILHQREDTLNDKVVRLEKKLNNLIQERIEDSSEKQTTDRKSFHKIIETKLEELENELSRKLKKQSNQMDQEFQDHQEIFHTEVEKTRNQIVSKFEQEYEEHKSTIGKQTDKAIELLSTRFQSLADLVQHQLEQMSTETKENMTMQKQTLSDCLLSIDGVQKQMKNLQRDHDQMSEEVNQRAWTAEQTCVRLSEDVMKRLNDRKTKGRKEGLEREEIIEKEIKIMREEMEKMKKEYRRELRERDRKLMELMQGAEMHLRNLRDNGTGVDQENEMSGNGEEKWEKMEKKLERKFERLEENQRRIERKVEKLEENVESVKEETSQRIEREVMEKKYQELLEKAEISKETMIEKREENQVIRTEKELEILLSTIDQMEQTPKAKVKNRKKDFINEEKRMTPSLGNYASSTSSSKLKHKSKSLHPKKQFKRRSISSLM